MIWTDEYIDGTLERAEVETSFVVPIIFKRVPLTVTAGVANYTLPDYVMGIRRISWKGYKVEPIERMGMDVIRNFRPNNLSTVSGRPLVYMRQDYGFKQITFYPIPSESLEAGNADETDGEFIRSKVILSLELSVNGDYELPEPLRRNLLKYYSLYRCFLKEGKGQNLVASEYFKQKYDYYVEQYKLLNNNSFACIKNYLSDDQFNPQKLKIGRPSLPTGGAWSF